MESENDRNVSVAKTDSNYVISLHKKQKNKKKKRGTRAKRLRDSRRNCLSEYLQKGLPFTFYYTWENVKC